MGAPSPHLSSYTGVLRSYKLTRREASQGCGVGRILNGAKPSGLPVVQSTRFELTINLKTAKALDLEIPANVLGLARRVDRREVGLGFGMAAASSGWSDRDRECPYRCGVEPAHEHWRLGSVL